MVSNPVQPFIIPVTIRRPHTGNGVRYGALIDSGCTQCLINQKVVRELGIGECRMAKPIRFEQVDS